MGEIDNQVIFYAGIITTLVALIAGITGFCVARIRRMRLQTKLELEYGPIGH